MQHESLESALEKNKKHLEEIRSGLNPIDIEEAIKEGKLNNVTIMRGSGKMEEGWDVIGFNFHEGTVRVCNKDNQMKTVLLEDLRNWN